MIWMTWRQHRKEALYAALGLLALAALLVPTGLRMYDFLDDTGLATCLEKLGGEGALTARGCDRLSQQFDERFEIFTYIGVLCVLLPLLIGLFFGAPLIAREIEHGTHRLVWTQGISRRHWALAKFGMLGTFAVAVAVVYSLGVGWWMEPLARVGPGRLAYLFFDVQGVVPIAYTLFAVALGACAGVFVRRTLPAMALTLGAFLAVRIAVETLARQRYMPSKTMKFPLTSNELPNTAVGDWTLSRGVDNAEGKLVVPDATMSCQPPGGAGAGGGREPGAEGAMSTADCQADFARQGLGPGSYNWRTYQPGDRFWTFQAIETGVFLVLTALLLLLAVRRLRRVA